MQEQGTSVSAFAAETGITFPILADRDGSVSSAYRVTSLPTTVIVDREGVIHEMLIGGPLTRALILSKVAPLLAEGGGG
jgi:peroxiredoxin